MAWLERRTTKPSAAHPKGEQRYDVVWRLPNGKRKARTFRRLADARAAMAEIELLETQGSHGPDRSGGRQTFAAWSDTWLAGRVLAPTTAQLYAYLLRRWLLPAFAETPLQALRADAIRVWHADVHRQAPSAAAKAYRLLRTMLDTAVRDGHLARNPADIDGAGREEAPERPVLEVEQIFALADAIHQRLRAPLLTTAFGPALRLGELIGLRRRDVDLIRRTLAVVEQRDQHGNVRTPKTAAGSRTAVLPRAVVDAIELHLVRYPQTALDGPLFTGPKGGPLNRGWMHARWTEARKAVDLEHVVWHDLRHSAATLVAQQGATLAELQQLVGHASPRAALRYQHIGQRRQQELADRLDEQLTARGRLKVADVVDLPDRAGDRAP